MGKFLKLWKEYAHAHEIFCMIHRFQLQLKLPNMMLNDVEIDLKRDINYCRERGKILSTVPETHKKKCFIM